MTLSLNPISGNPSSRNGSGASDGLVRIWLALHLAVLIAAAIAGWLSSASTSSKSTWKPLLRKEPLVRQDIGTPSPRSPQSSARYISASYEPTDSCNPADPGLSEVWELSSRHLPERFRCINPVEPGLRAQRPTPVGWQADALENALVNDGRLVILYVHGNFMERNNARERALILNEYLRQRSQRPYRLLMLSWPSEREPHPLRDVYENAESAESQALFVGWLLERLSQHSDVSLLGFSFGARAVTGGLHFASGGTIPGYQYRPISDLQSHPRSYRLALVAPALDRGWIAKGGKHERSLDNVSGLVNLYNSQDPILRRFRFLDRIGRPVAAGFAGFIGHPGIEGVSNPRATEPLANSNKIRQFDCGSGIGTTHSERSYYAQCPYFGIVLDHLLGQESNANPIE